MRDTIKDKEYFEEYINREYEGIEFFGKLLQDEGKKDKFDSFKNQIWMGKLNIMYAMYSKGDDIDIVNEQFNSLIDDWIELFRTRAFKPAHGELVNMVALFILFDEQEQAKQICDEYLSEDEKNDWILNFLLVDDIEGLDSMEGDIKYEKLYLPIKKMVIDRDIEHIKEYMQNIWYSAHSDFAWHNRHKSKFDIYCGYWAFLIGAIVKKLNLDDSSLKGVKYYPIDLVHYKKQIIL